MKTSKKLNPIPALVKVHVYFDFYKNLDILTVSKYFSDHNTIHEVVPSTNPMYHYIKMSVTKLPAKPIIHFAFHDIEF